MSPALLVLCLAHLELVALKSKMAASQRLPERMSRYQTIASSKSHGHSDLRESSPGGDEHRKNQFNDKDNHRQSHRNDPNRKKIVNYNRRFASNRRSSPSNLVPIPPREKKREFNVKKTFKKHRVINSLNESTLINANNLTSHIPLSQTYSPQEAHSQTSVSQGASQTLHRQNEPIFTQRSLPTLTNKKQLTFSHAKIDYRTFSINPRSSRSTKVDSILRRQSVENMKSSFDEKKPGTSFLETANRSQNRRMRPNRRKRNSETTNPKAPTRESGQPKKFERKEPLTIERNNQKTQTKKEDAPLKDTTGSKKNDGNIKHETEKVKLTEQNRDGFHKSNFNKSTVTLPSQHTYKRSYFPSGGIKSEPTEEREQSSAEDIFVPGRKSDKRVIQKDTIDGESESRLRNVQPTPPSELQLYATIQELVSDVKELRRQQQQDRRRLQNLELRFRSKIKDQQDTPAETNETKEGWKIVQDALMDLDLQTLELRKESEAVKIQRQQYLRATNENMAANENLVKKVDRFSRVCSRRITTLKQKSDSDIKSAISSIKTAGQEMKQIKEDYKSLKDEFRNLKKETGDKFGKINSNVTNLIEVEIRDVNLQVHELEKNVSEITSLFEKYKDEHVAMEDQIDELQAAVYLYMEPDADDQPREAHLLASAAASSGGKSRKSRHLSKSTEAQQANKDDRKNGENNTADKNVSFYNKYFISGTVHGGRGANLQNMNEITENEQLLLSLILKTTNHSFPIETTNRSSLPLATTDYVTLPLAQANHSSVTLVTTNHSLLPLETANNDSSRSLTTDKSFLSSETNEHLFLMETTTTSHRGISLEGNHFIDDVEEQVSLFASQTSSILSSLSRLSDSYFTNSSPNETDATIFRFSTSSTSFTNKQLPASYEAPLLAQSFIAAQSPSRYLIPSKSTYKTLEPSGHEIMASKPTSQILLQSDNTTLQTKPIPYPTFNPTLKTKSSPYQTLNPTLQVKSIPYPTLSQVNLESTQKSTSNFLHPSINKPIELKTQLHPSYTSPILATPALSQSAAYYRRLTTAILDGLPIFSPFYSDDSDPSKINSPQIVAPTSETKPLLHLTSLPLQIAVKDEEGSNTADLNSTRHSHLTSIIQSDVLLDNVATGYLHTETGNKAAEELQAIPVLQSSKYSKLNVLHPSHAPDMDVMHLLDVSRLSVISLSDVDILSLLSSSDMKVISSYDIDVTGPSTIDVISASSSSDMEVMSPSGMEVINPSDIDFISQSDIDVISPLHKDVISPSHKDVISPLDIDVISSPSSSDDDVLHFTDLFSFVIDNSPDTSVHIHSPRVSDISVLQPSQTDISFSTEQSYTSLLYSSHGDDSVIQSHAVNVPTSSSTIDLNNINLDESFSDPMAKNTAENSLLVQAIRFKQTSFGASTTDEHSAILSSTSAFHANMTQTERHTQEKPAIELDANMTQTDRHTLEITVTKSDSNMTKADHHTLTAAGSDLNMTQTDRHTLETDTISLDLKHNTSNNQDGIEHVYHSRDHVINKQAIDYIEKLEQRIQALELSVVHMAKFNHQQSRDGDSGWNQTSGLGNEINLQKQKSELQKMVDTENHTSGLDQEIQELNLQKQMSQPMAMFGTERPLMENNTTGLSLDLQQQNQNFQKQMSDLRTKLDTERRVMENHTSSLEYKIQQQHQGLQKQMSDLRTKLDTERRVMENHTSSLYYKIQQQHQGLQKQMSELKTMLDTELMLIENHTSGLWEEIQKKAADIEHIQAVSEQTSLIVAYLASQVSSINMEEFITKLHQSLRNFTQNVVTRDQLRHANDQIINATLKNEERIHKMTETAHDTTHSVSKLHERVSSMHSMVQTWYRSLQGHIIRLNNTVQDLREHIDQLSHVQDNTDQSRSIAKGDALINSDMKTMLDSLNIQLLYNANRLSMLEAAMLNQSLIQCRSSSAEAEQESKILSLNERQEKNRKELLLLTDKVNRVDLNVLWVQSTVKATDRNVGSLRNNVTQLLSIVPQVEHLQKEVDNAALLVPQDCHDYFLRGFQDSGVYIIKPKNLNRTIRVFCLMEGTLQGNTACGCCNGCNSKTTISYDSADKGGDNSMGDSFKPGEKTNINSYEGVISSGGDMRSCLGGWTILQRRESGKVNFTRPWLDYANGFGDISNEYWLGNDVTHLLSFQRDYELRIKMVDMFSNTWEAGYELFKIGGNNNGYRIEIGGYYGNASDGMVYSNMMAFSAVDMDNDASSSHCAMYNGGGWWYRHCHVSNLNGPYDAGMVWFNRDWQDWIQIRSSIIMIRPKSG